VRSWLEVEGKEQTHADFRVPVGAFQDYVLMGEINPRMVA